MQTSIAMRIFNAITLAAGAGGVRWSGSEYQWIFEVVFYLSLLSAGILLAHAAWSHRASIRARIASVEPSHVIILGLLIALGGVIWHLRSEPQSKAADIDRILELQRQLAARPSSPPNAPVRTLPAASKYTPAQKKILDEELIQLSEIINKKAIPASALANKFIRDFGARGWTAPSIPLKKDVLIDRIMAIHDAVQAISDQIIKELISHSSFNEDLTAAVGTATVPAMGSSRTGPQFYNLTQSALGFVGDINELARINKDGDDFTHASGMLQKAHNHFVAAASDFEQWIEASKMRIKEMQKPLK